MSKPIMHNSYEQLVPVFPEIDNALLTNLSVQWSYEGSLNSQLFQNTTDCSMLAWCVVTGRVLVVLSGSFYV